VRWSSAILVLIVGACGGESSSSLDAAGSSPDASVADAVEPTDATRADVIGTDARVADVPAFDAEPSDAAALDAGFEADASRVDTGEWSFPPRALCATRYVAPVATGTVGDPGLNEISGIIASPSNPDLVWLHNDSGDEARLYGLSTRGRARGRLTLAGLHLFDLEDIAAGPCPDLTGPCLWLADTGDNAHMRDHAVVYAVPEPALTSTSAFGDLDATRWWRFPIDYPFGAIDSEALAVDPGGVTFYLFEKIDGDRAQLFRHPGPLEDNVQVTMERMGSFASPGVPVRLGRMITAADLHPTRDRIVLRVYTGIFEYRLDPGASLARLDMATRVAAPITFAERQGEALGYDVEGTGLWSASEGAGQNLHHYECSP